LLSFRSYPDIFKTSITHRLIIINPDDIQFLIDMCSKFRNLETIKKCLQNNLFSRIDKGLMIHFIYTCYMLHTTCHMLHATCYMPHATCHMLHATCYMLQATCYMQHATCYMIHATCHLLNATCYMLHATRTCHMLHATCHLLVHASLDIFKMKSK